MLPGVYITFDRVAGAVATDKPCRYRQVEWIPNGMAFGGGPPANRPPHCPPCSPARCANQLSFSIDRILAPDFGRTTAHKAAVQPAIILPPSPKTSDFDNRSSGIDDSEYSKSILDDETRNFVENNTPGDASLFRTSSISLEDHVFDTIALDARNDIHNTSRANCCSQTIHDSSVTARVTNPVSVMIPKETQKTHQVLSNWMPPDSESTISQSPVKEFRHSSANDCAMPQEKKKLLEQYRSRATHETFQQEASTLIDHATPGSPSNVKHSMPTTLESICVVVSSPNNSEKAAACKSGSSRSSRSPDVGKSQEHSELPPALYTPSSKNAEMRTTDDATYALAFSDSDYPQTSSSSPPRNALKTKFLKTPAVNDSNRLCRSLSPSTLRTNEGTFSSEVPNDSNSTINADSSRNGSQQQELSTDSDKPVTWPAWVYCTRYSDRPSSGPRSRRKNRLSSQGDEKRSRTAFTGTQLSRLRQEFQENRYLTEQTRLRLAKELRLTESQVKIWFQNKRAKLKKSTGQKNPLALQLMAQGLYKHSVQNDSKDK